MTATNDNPLVAFSEAMADAVAKAGASTVLVDARRRHPASGISIASDLVLTANHVVERDDDLSVGLADGNKFDALLVGRDPGNDLAVLRVNGANLLAAERAPSEARVGQLVLALGRPDGNGIQASLGVVSAVGGPVRSGRGGMLERYLRTDTIPYPGFSGGALVDAAGLVLGMNTSGLWRGGSLTIPASLSWVAAETIARYGRVKRGYLGVRSQAVALPAAQRAALKREQAMGLLLVGVEDNSPAENGGLLLGDILVGLAGEPVTDPDDLVARLTGEIVDAPAEVEILRGGQVLTLKVIIGERK